MALLAQLVEQRTFNPQTEGSSPSERTIWKLQNSHRTDCNPPASRSLRWFNPTSHHQKSLTFQMPSFPMCTNEDSQKLTLLYYWENRLRRLMLRFGFCHSSHCPDLFMIFYIHCISLSRGERYMNQIPRCMYISSFLSFIRTDENAIFGVLCDNYHGDALTTTRELGSPKSQS